MQTMSTQTKNYLSEMKEMYLSIMKKYFNEQELTKADILFLEIYKRTIENTIEIPQIELK